MMTIKIANGRAVFYCNIDTPYAPRHGELGSIAVVQVQVQREGHEHEEYLLEYWENGGLCVVKL